MGRIGWTTEIMLDQSGRTAIDTGANTGIGFETARVLAKKGARVILACRNSEKAGTAADKIAATEPSGSVEIGLLDLSNLASVRTFAAGFLASSNRLDLLINNAGVMTPPFSKTADGFEKQMGTNHLGHFALTGLLLPVLLKTAGARVVTVSSLAHKMGTLDFDDLHYEKKPYRKWAAYGQSKLANLLFAYALQRRFEAAGVDVQSLSAHPGWAGTELLRYSGWMQWFNPLFAMSPEKGALPTVYAAVSSEARGGDFIGPDGFLEMWGGPKKVGSSARSQNEDAARRLFEISELLTGVTFEFELNP